MNRDLTALKAPLLAACDARYGVSLISVIVFGSWAKKTATPESDLDLLIVASPLISGRGKRMKQFLAVEDATKSARQAVWGAAFPPLEISPVIKTPHEVAMGSPLFLDMTEWADIWFDREQFFSKYLQTLKKRMSENGTVRKSALGGYYWIYKPDARPGEIIAL